MEYHINAILTDGTSVFNGTAGWVPHKGEEIEIGACSYIVHHVRYKLKAGTAYHTDVDLLLVQIR
jgi:hypothetical protein